ncbi:acetyltransferase family protein [Gottschalkia purinilytica]|uniref:Acetyltransferase family protein n=1 Tax=Gottschalkia purinilytica TaxID=1503 RepID=A0A0L0W9Y5_GOTPU|nr:GNAT family N-acetyltransferase [Gottschalkia purinilytica]KNF08266.1 acetyltransferase family protein [Gottschalkia purinilytica]
MKWYIKKFNELNSIELYNILKERVDTFVVGQNHLFQDCDDKDIEAFHVMLKEGDNVLAYLRILPPGISYEECSFGRVLVSKDYRGRGFAKELISKTMEFIDKEIKLNKVRISAQEYLIDFYKNFGFKVTSELYYIDNIPHVDMLYKR